jgi:hypothetical protein
MSVVGGGGAEGIYYGQKQSDEETSKVVPVHATKAYGATGDTAPIILDIGTRVTFTIRSLYPQANSPRTR